MKLKHKLLLLAIATTAFSMFQQKDAKAGITFCNRTNETIWVAHGYALDLRTVRIAGWWQVVSGACKEVYIGSAFDVIKTAGQIDRVRVQMYHAESASGRSWGNSPISFCVTQSEFKTNQRYDSVNNRTTESKCNRGFSMRKFTQIQVRGFDKTVDIR